VGCGNNRKQTKLLDRTIRGEVIAVWIALSMRHGCPSSIPSVNLSTSILCALDYIISAYYFYLSLAGLINRFCCVVFCFLSCNIVHQNRGY
jgi:hypothetical protein